MGRVGERGGAEGVDGSDNCNCMVVGGGGSRSGSVRGSGSWGG